jgi:hypothetical protein
MRQVIDERTQAPPGEAAGEQVPQVDAVVPL